MWKKKFVKLMFESDLTKTNIEKALSLKYNNIPSSLYKYKAFNPEDDSLRFILEDKIKLSDPKNFNDPFDCSISFSKEKIDNETFISFMKDPLFLSIRNHLFSEGEIQKIINSKNPHECFMVIFEEKYPHINTVKLKESFDNGVNMHEYYNLLKDITYIACYSETKSSITMWSHYADHHKGICVEYNFKELVNPTLTNPYTLLYIVIGFWIYLNIRDLIEVKN